MVNLGSKHTTTTGDKLYRGQTDVLQMPLMVTVSGLTL